MGYIYFLLISFQSHLPPGAVLNMLFQKLGNLNGRNAVNSS